MIQSPTKSANSFRHGVLTLSAAVALVTMLAVPSSAQEILFNPGQAQGQNIREFEISPDGTQIAWSGVLDNGVTTAGQQLYAGSLTPGDNLGGNPGPRVGANQAIRLDPNNQGDADSAPRWTPDGLSVISRFDTTGNNEIYMFPADGSQTVQQLTFNSTNAFDPKVSADGQFLFYSDDDANGVGRLFRTPIVGASASSSVLLNGGDISEIDTGGYAIVGSDVIFEGFATPVPGANNGTRETALYRTAADGSGTPTLIPINNLPDNTALNFGAFEVTPDGQTIIAIGDLLVNGRFQLFSLPIAGGDFTPLFDDPRPVDNDFSVNLFKVSNDGSSVLFVADFLQNGIGEAFIVPTAGGTPIRVSDTADFTVDNGLDVAFNLPPRLGFSTDDQFLYYVADGGLEGATTTAYSHCTAWKILSQ